MGCYQRKLAKGVRWRYRGQYLGKPYHSKAIYLTKKECKKAEADKIAEIDEATRSPKTDVGLLELFSHRLDNLQLIRNKEYFEDCKRLSKQAIQAWGAVKASEVTKKMVSDLILEEVKRCKKQGLTYSRPNKLFATIRANFNHAIKHFGVDMKNPCDGLSKLPEDRNVKFIPSEEMIIAVRKACNPEQQRLIDFVYETGCRVGECINLDYSDIKEDMVVLYTRKSRNSVKTPRFVPKPDWLEKGKGKVFKHNAYPRFLEGKVKMLGQPKWNWHGLRRRRASIWANDDVPLFQIMMLLGHSNVSTTQRYLFNLGIVKM